MPAFLKEIIRPGTYHPVDPSTGKTRTKVVTPQDVHHFAKAFSDMRKSGLKVPAPKMHYLQDGSGKLYVPGPSDNFRKSDDYVGHWKQTWIDKSTGALMGVLDVPLEDDAKKIGTVITEVSPYISPEFTDGSGKKWENCLRHIAVVQHPVINGQPNFKPLPNESELAGVGMSLPLSSYAFSSSAPPAKPPKAKKPEDETQDDAEDTDDLGDNPETKKPADPENIPEDENENGTIDGDEGLKETIQLLKETVGLELPPDTDATNFLDRIRSAVYTLKGQKEATGSVSTPPVESEEEEAPVAMALTDAQVAEKIKAATDAQAAAFSAQLADLTTQIKTRDAAVCNARKQNYGQRINALLATGRVTKDYADKTLAPMVNGYAFSLQADGNPAPTALDATLAALEALPAKQGMNPFEAGFSLPMDPPAGSYAPANPAKADEFTEEDAEKLVNEVTAGKGQFRQPAKV